METMGGRDKTVVISGYYGFANSGDEAVLHAITTAVRDEAAAAGVNVRMVVLSANPAETTRIHGVEAVHRMRPLDLIRALWSADALISGGGSLLQDVTSSRSVPYYLGIVRLAQLMRKPVYIYAQGIGPILDRKRFGPMIRSMFRACRYVSVRDQESKELLVSFGLKPDSIEVVPDPVMGMGAGISVSAAGPAREDLAVGVSVRYWREDRADLKALAEGLRRVGEARPDVRFVLLPFHLPADRDASEFVAGELASAGLASERVQVHSGTEHPREMLQLVSGCDVLVGMRLHSLIYAATTGVPPVGVSYDPKIDQFLRRLGESPAGTTENLDAVALSGKVLQRLEQGRLNWYRDKSTIIQEMQEDSRKPAQQIFLASRI